VTPAPAGRPDDPGGPDQGARRVQHNGWPVSHVLAAAAAALGFVLAQALVVAGFMVLDAFASGCFSLGGIG
jgi:hypothetical protein